MKLFCISGLTKLTALLPMLLIGNPIARADSGSRYPGSHCTVYKGTPSYDNGTLVNKASVPLEIECALETRWSTPQNHVLGLSDVSARVVDNHPSQNVKCELFTADVSGTDSPALDLLSFQTRYSVGGSLAPQTIRFGFAPTNEKTYSVLRCVIPPRSGQWGSRFISYSSEIDYELQ